MIQLFDLSVQVEQVSVVADCSVLFDSGKIHVLMGPNGSGKSSLAHAIMGHPSYQVVQGSIMYNAVDITAVSMMDRAKQGIFLAHQHVVAIPGLQVFRYLHELVCLHRNARVDVDTALGLIRPLLKMVDLSESVLYRHLYDGFSGGEKKRLEIVQMLLIQPRCIILDEIDSGLDVDGLSKIAQALLWYKQQNPDVTMIVITHYAALMQYLPADRVHVMIHKKIVVSSDASLINYIAQNGFESYV